MMSLTPLRATHGSSTAVLALVLSAACGETSSDFDDPNRGGSSAGGTRPGGGSPATGGMGGSPVAGSAGSGAGTGAAGSGPGRSGGSAGGEHGGGSSGATPVSCTIAATAAASTVIPTVGVVTFSTDLAGLSAARIEFGLTTAYGSSAPVSLTEPSYRTLLLGMKASRTVHFRVVLRAGANECSGPDQTFTTGALGDNLPTVELETNDQAALAGGYLVGTHSQSGSAFILDADGDIVWWFGSGNASRAMLSADSRYLWLLATNQAGGNPNVRRVAMDGVGGAERHTEFGDAHHDLVVLPDDSVGFLQYYMNGRDRVMERAPDGSVRQIVDIPTAHGGTADNHSNSIQYFAPDDSYTVSDLDQNCYVKVSRQGQVAWVLGGDTSDFTGPGATWNREHGHQMLAPNRILFFNNGATGANSIAREVTLDLTMMTAANTWQYDGDENSNTLGDVQRLWNGNTFVTYSNAGTFHEINSNGDLLESISFSAGGGVGYATKRQSLYGPGPKQAPP
ncbi:MAG TPA: aryl-sulfate sulfotransferase [Polyangiaceae bacterium]